jgi:hypothetical protein
MTLTLDGSAVTITDCPREDLERAVRAAAVLLNVTAPEVLAAPGPAGWAVWRARDGRGGGR